MDTYVQIYTGNGKGKTTAALGVIVRALGHNYKVLLIQFLKGRDYGELHSLEKFENLTIKRYGRGVFIKDKKNVTIEDKILIRNGYEELKKNISTGEYNIIVADEILGTLRYDLISTEEIKNLILLKNKNTEFIMTGRNAPKELIDLADLVTEMKEIKHYFKKGVMARIGIEK